MPKIKVNDIEMYYEIQGKGEPLVLVGGFSADHTMWNTVLEKLAQHYQVVTFDNRGTGQTNVPNGPYSVDQFASDTAALCEKLNIKKAHFIGSSMGGFVVQTLAYRFPALVKSLVLTNSTLQVETTFLFQMKAQLEFLKAGAPQHAVILAGAAWIFSYKLLSQPGMIENILQMRMSNPFPFTITGYEGQLAAVSTFNSKRWVHHIAAPTLVIASDQDLVFREGIVRPLAEKISGAQYFCFTDCGHVPSLEYPDQFVTLVTAFLRGV